MPTELTQTKQKLESNKDITLQVVPDTGITLMYFNTQAGAR